MFNPEKCEISVKILDGNKPHMKALIAFRQDGVRLSGFVIKDGPYGLYLDPPRIPPKYMEVFFDENKERYKELQVKAVQAYEEELEKTKQVEEIDMALLDEVWEGEVPNSNNGNNK